MPIGMVYLIQAGDAYKIGHTSNLQKRLRAHQTHNPLPVTVIHTWEVDNPSRLEIFFHRLLKTSHITGEWFSLTDEQVKSLQMIQDWSEDFEQQLPQRGYMIAIEIEVYACKCSVCGYEWHTESLVFPERCAKPTCRSKVWNRPAIKLGRPRGSGRFKHPRPDA